MAYQKNEYNFVMFERKALCQICGAKKSLIEFRYQNENKQCRLKDVRAAATATSDDKIGAEFPTD